MKIQYVKKAKNDLTPSKDISSDETKDSDTPHPKSIPSFSKLETKESSPVSKNELREVMMEKTKWYIPKVEHKFKTITKDIPLPHLLDA